MPKQVTNVASDDALTTIYIELPMMKMKKQKLLELLKDLVLGLHQSAACLRD